MENPCRTSRHKPISQFDDLSIWRFEDEKKCFLKIGEIKKRWKYSSEFYYANRNHLEETV